MYHGRRRHDRLFKQVGLKIWNFTGRGAIIPDLSAVQDLITCPGTCKNNRSVKNTYDNAYGWCAEIPGDMHAKGDISVKLYLRRMVAVLFTKL